MHVLKTTALIANKHDYAFKKLQAVLRIYHYFGFGLILSTAMIYCPVIELFRLNLFRSASKLKAVIKDSHTLFFICAAHKPIVIDSFPE